MKGMFGLLAKWKIQAYDSATGETTYHEGKNILVQAGRRDLFYLLFALSASSTMNCMAFGACSIAPSATDTRLNYEYIANGTRKLLTNTSGAPLSSSDVINQTYIDGDTGITYYELFVVQSVIGPSDANATLEGSPVQEYAIADTVACPGSPTGTSGGLLNHYVDNIPIYLTPTTTLTIQVEFRS